MYKFPVGKSRLIPFIPIYGYGQSAMTIVFKTWTQYVVSFDAIPDEHTISYLFPPSQPFIVKKKILCKILSCRIKRCYYFLYLFRQRIFLSLTSRLIVCYKLCESVERFHGLHVVASDVQHFNVFFIHQLSKCISAKTQVTTVMWY